MTFRLGNLRHLNWKILLLITLIVSIGFAMLLSAADGNLSPWAGKQMIRFSIAMVFMIVIALTDIRFWMSLAYPFYMLTFLLLLGVELMGFIGKGGQRWIDLYIVQLQPSELMKIALILALARYFHLCQLDEIRRLPTLIFPITLVLLPTLLVMRQPDLGTAMILILSATVIFFAAGVRLWKFFVVGGSVLAALPILWNFLYDYQKKRVLIFLDPESDPTQSGYHLKQSKIALGSGGLFGKGYGEGTQSHLSFLPEKQTDFIFTMFSEEFGFVGGLVLVILYALLIVHGIRVAFNNRLHFAQLVTIGISSTFFLYAFINMGMVMGMLPVVGVPLPLISYGGTALLTLLMGQGFIFSSEIYQRARLDRE
jgi:rod shape determining protein RodA